MVKKFDLSNKWKIRKGDTVFVRSGKDKGKKAKVIMMFPKEGRLIADGVNLVKKHVRPKKSGEKGQVVEIPSHMPIARVMLVCTACGKATRAGIKITEKENGKKQRDRVCKKCSAVIV